jgi:hypothetical protein
MFINSFDEYSSDYVDWIYDMVMYVERNSGQKDKKWANILFHIFISYINLSKFLLLNKNNPL